MSGARSKWLVTGATGFLGRHVIGTIRARDPDAGIVAIVRDPARAATLDYMGGVDMVTGSPVEPAGWQEHSRLDGIRGVYHLAAQVRHSRSGSDEMTRLNVDATRAIVRLAAHRGWRTVFVSTSGTVGCSRDPAAAPDEDAPHADAIVRCWPYYWSKIIAEREARALASELGAELVIVRPPVLLGPGDHRYRSVGNVMRVLRGKLPFILDGGMHFADIRDAARAMVAAMTHPSPRPVYNLPGTASSLDWFFRLVARQAGIEPSWKILPARIIWYAARVNEMLGSRLHILPDPVVIEMAGHHWGLSSLYSHRDLDYTVRSPDVTIADTINWIRRHSPDSGPQSVSGPVREESRSRRSRC